MGRPFSFLGLFPLAQAPNPSPRKRAICYIDGFNLYYGAVKQTPYKWLNIQELCVSLRSSDDVVAVRYFTSKVVGMKAAERQAIFLRALRTLPLVSIHQGSFTRKNVGCEVPFCQHAGHKNYDVLVEKKTDVNIAIHMLDDAHHDRCDVFVVISGDTDLVPAVSMIRSEYPTKHVGVYVPIKAGMARADARRSNALREAAHRGGFLSPTLVAGSQFPNTVTDSLGRTTAKPFSW